MMMRLCVACALLLGVAVVSPAAAFCAERGSDPKQCRNITSGSDKLTCDVGKEPNTAMKYEPTDKGDTRFAASDYKMSCLGNAGVACDKRANTIDIQTPDNRTSCCSCFLYAGYCWKKQASKYVMDVKSYQQSKPPHALLMPTQPCTGVDNWNKNNKDNNCPSDSNNGQHEAIWNAAQGELDAAGRDATWGMAINSVGRRGQHQMHIHLAQIYPSLASSIAYAHNSLGLAGPFRLDCKLTKKKRLLDKCSILPASATADDFNPRVRIVSGINGPAFSKPFETIYTTSPSAQVKNVLQTSLLVVRVPYDKTAWALVENFEDAAECYYKNNGDASLASACKDS